MILTFLEYIV